MKRILFSNNFKIVQNFEIQYCRVFKPFYIPGVEDSSRFKKPFRVYKKSQPRYEEIREDADWTNLWPAATSFNYSAVPIPLYQGFSKNSEENNHQPPGKYGNRELLKIPNFLHLTPRHIEKHCKAMKKYCTKWPEELTDVAVNHHLPLHVKYSNYVHSAPSIRDPRARKVTIELEMRHLNLDVRERSKLLKLVGRNCYQREKDLLIISADRCPTRQQNRDYLTYLLTALLKESKKFENWETEQAEADWMEYQWDKSRFKDNMDTFVDQCKMSGSEPEVVELRDQMRNAVGTLYSRSTQRGESGSQSVEDMNEYRDAVLRLLEVTKVTNVTGKSQATE